MKVIKNDKDFLDQSLDEVKLLRYLNVNCDDVDKKHVSNRHTHTHIHTTIGTRLE